MISLSQKIYFIKFAFTNPFMAMLRWKSHNICFVSFRAQEYLFQGGANNSFEIHSSCNHCRGKESTLANTQNRNKTRQKGKT